MSEKDRPQADKFKLAGVSFPFVILEMRAFADGSIAALSANDWMIWEPRGGLRNWSPSDDPNGDLWNDCNAASLVERKSAAVT